MNIASDKSVGVFVITQDQVYLLTTNNEKNRLIQEEKQNYPFEIVTRPWYESSTLILMQEKGIEGSILEESECEQDLSKLRSVLTDLETVRLYELGKLSSDILETCLEEIQVGMSEFEVAGKLSNMFLAEGIYPLVLNIAADERAKQFRHPIPTTNRIKQYLSVSICTMKWGLHVTCTRIVHFGALPEELSNKHKIAMELEANAILRSNPDAKVEDIFSNMLDGYQQHQLKDEWKEHPIGGLVGFKPREFDVTPMTRYNLQTNQVFCWNPTIQGTKSEDTILITNDGPQLVTKSSKFPTTIFTVLGKSIERPNILVREIT